MNKITKTFIGLLAAATGLNITVHCMFHAIKAETEETKRYAEINERLDDVHFKLNEIWQDTSRINIRLIPTSTPTPYPTVTPTLTPTPTAQNIIIKSRNIEVELSQDGIVKWRELPEPTPTPEPATWRIESSTFHIEDFGAYRYEIREATRYGYEKINKHSLQDLFNQYGLTISDAKRPSYCWEYNGEN